MSVCSQIPGGTILKNGGFGEEFLVKMTQTLLEKATLEAFRAILDIDDLVQLNENMLVFAKCHSSSIFVEKY